MIKEDKVLEGFYLSIEYFRKEACQNPNTCYDNQLKVAGIIHAMARADIIGPLEFTYMDTLLWSDVKGLFMYAYNKVGY